MAKYRVTKKEMRATGNKILKIPYCKAQNLLAYCDPYAYSEGAYGWSCDYYDVDGVIISTGYYPIGSAINPDLLSKCEHAAEIIRAKDNLSRDDKIFALASLVKSLSMAI